LKYQCDIATTQKVVAISLDLLVRIRKVGGECEKPPSLRLTPSSDRLGDYGMHILASARMCVAGPRVLRYDFLAEAMGFAILKPRHDKRRH